MATNTHNVDVVRTIATGVELIAHERERQQYEEGWGAEHDEQHDNHELPIVAACYAVAGLEKVAVVRTLRSDAVVDAWPPRWAKRWDKRNTHPRLKALAIAGALIAAEIDRLQALGLQNEIDAADDAAEKWTEEHPELPQIVGALSGALAGGNKKGLREAASFAVESLRKTMPHIFGRDPS